MTYAVQGRGAKEKKNQKPAKHLRRHGARMPISNYNESNKTLLIRFRSI